MGGSTVRFTCTMTAGRFFKYGPWGIDSMGHVGITSKWKRETLWILKSGIPRLK